MGIGEQWEARIEGNTYTRENISDPSNGNTRNEGFAPTSLGIKYQFQGFDSSVQPSLATIVRIFPSFGSGEFPSTHITGDIRLAADWDLSPTWSLNPNLGLVT
jgi:hypothetical protein